MLECYQLYFKTQRTSLRYIHWSCIMYIDFHPMGPLKTKGYFHIHFLKWEIQLTENTSCFSLPFILLDCQSQLAKTKIYLNTSLINKSKLPRANEFPLITSAHAISAESRK